MHSICTEGTAGSADQDTVVAVRRHGEELHIINSNEKKYPAHHYSVDPEQEVDIASKAWTNYFLAAYKVHSTLKSDSSVTDAFRREFMSS